jgi:hypothetical protein
VSSLKRTTEFFSLISEQFCNSGRNHLELQEISGELNNIPDYSLLRNVLVTALLHLYHIVWCSADNSMHRRVFIRSIIKLETKYGQNQVKYASSEE